jgi:hypothetical protein
MSAAHRNSYRAAHRHAPVNCPSCGREVQRQARHQRFCSTRCKEKARTRVRMPVGALPPGRLPKTRLKLFLPTNSPKKTNEISGAQQAKIRASKDVLDIEIWGDRIWQPAISSDGVLIVIGRLRARALVERSGGAS